ncbi:hypothetical protein COCON_G00024230 [Conger conger]|uniref:GOST seven transmembrane domain-containing protein n=1 Tax=Conger conger TaxID=82655 RepID=A0A9Q1I6K2_CONCO|nr:protein GPR108-like isoform X2 [Conger conger]KAJ8283573.1 hypothetical protein COCON_G00024230 [Conger conger]
MAMYREACFSLFVAALLIGICDARIHHLVLKNETRFVIRLNTFGFYANGTLDVNLKALTLNLKALRKEQEQNIDFVKYPIGFSLSKSRVNSLLAYTAQDAEECQLTKSKSEQPLILFLIDIDKRSVTVRSFGMQDSVLSSTLKAKEENAQVPRKKEKRDLGSDQSKTTTGTKQDTVPDQSKTTKDENQDTVPDQSKTTKDENQDTVPDQSKTGGDGNQDTVPDQSKTGGDGNQDTVPDQSKTTKDEKQGKKIDGMTLELQRIGESYNFSFHLKIGSLDEGLYNLNFHNCPSKSLPYDLNVEIVEQNPGGYLSAAEIPLPLLFICMAIIFFIAAMVWVHTLMKHRYSVFKIHWLMAALAFTKSISLVFHSINYHFINKEGHPIEGWAVMYYITHLLKGALLFITLALIGTGWAFVKYILSDKEKKIFMIVIPLQVLANVAYVIIESTEEGSTEYSLWMQVLFLVDLICCGAILFPVVWSIRHLQDASSTDGKAAMNLEKLKLFRHYYVMIVCYIYFTRIIAYLLKVAIPFQWQWFYEFLVEVSTLIFFVMTGYKFRPASNNPYLQLPLDEEDMEMDEVLTESGALEGISRVKKLQNGRERQREPSL